MAERDFDTAPYDASEQRLATWLAERTGIGGGNDPVGFVIAALEMKGAERAPVNEPPRRGRPSLTEGQKKRNTLTFRLRDDLRNQLLDAAEDNGCSLSEEVEHRVSASFEHAKTKANMSTEVYGVLDAIRARLDRIEGGSRAEHHQEIKEESHAAG